MNIREIQHNFRRPLSRRNRTDRVVFHHQAGNEVDAAIIHGWHLKRKTNTGSYWAGIGYHYIIMRNGEIQTGRPHWAYGAHGGTTVNGSSIGVMLTGNLDNHHPTEEQVRSVVHLVKRVLEPLYGKLIISGHREHMATSCPGRNFPMERLKTMIEGREARLMVNDREVKVDITNAGGRILLKVPGESGDVWVQARGLADAISGFPSGQGIRWDANTNTAHMRIR